MLGGMLNQRAPMGFDQDQASVRLTEIVENLVLNRQTSEMSHLNARKMQRA
jgi:hypothetical protein